MSELHTKEWAPYCADTIAMYGKVREPVEHFGARWICTSIGSGDSHVYRVADVCAYHPPAEGLPCTYAERNKLPERHPFRYGYEGMLVDWRGITYVLTDEHVVESHRWQPDPNDPDHYRPDPEWLPQRTPPIRYKSSPWGVEHWSPGAVQVVLL